MENKPKSLSANALTYSVIAAVIMIIYSLLLYIFDLNMNQWLSLVSYVILIAVTIWGTLEYRNKVLGGYISYGKAFGSTFLIGLFASIIMAIYVYVFFAFISPGSVQEIIELGRERMMESNPNMSDEDIERALDMQAWMMTPVGMAIYGFISQVIVTAIICLITSIFLKKEDKSLDKVM